MIPSILIGAAVLAAVVLAVRHIVKNRHHCGGDCASCGSDCCHPGNTDVIKEEIFGKIKDAEKRE